MPSALPFQDQCCTPCDETPTVNIPGAAGSDGTDGADGAAGVNAYTTTTADFTMPAAAGTVNVVVGSTAWATVGQIVYVGTAGHMEVSAKTNATTFVLENVDYTGNAAAATTIPSGSQVSPGGLAGAVGDITGIAAGGQLKGTYPNPNLDLPNEKGAIAVGNGTNAIELLSGGVGNDGKRWVLDDSAAGGVRVDTIDLSNLTETTAAALPISRGGTEATAIPAAFNNLSPVVARGSILTRDATNNIQRTVGTVGQVVRSDGTDTVYDDVIPAGLNTELKRVPSDVFIARYSEVAGSDGDTTALNTWTPIPLTDASGAEDTTSGGSKQIEYPGGSIFTLKDGYTYRIVGWCLVGNDSGAVSFKTRIRDVTNNVTKFIGSPVVAVTAGQSFMSRVEGRLVVSGANMNIEFQYFSNTAAAVLGLGFVDGDSEINVFAALNIEVEAINA